ncbi:MAG: histidine--tRNA ligase [Candidatus Brocadiia bacterium]
MSLTGTEDRLPGQWRYWTRLHESARRLFRLYGYGQISTPIIEYTDLFVKGTGETTDIVEKQMYNVGGEDEDDVTLRPEGTPPAVRAYLERDLHKQQQFQKFWYAGPMFRRERPQKGRLRQFHQIGVEAIGGESALLDAECALLPMALYRDVGLEKCRLFVNTIGCTQCRPAYQEELRVRLTERREELCENCQSRLDRNVLRILDCKNEDCQEVVSGLPVIDEFLCDNCKEHFDTFKATLDENGVDYDVDPLLVRGLDYYTRTVFEIKHPGLGARDTICGGGRYDELVELLGGPSLPCVGFAMGVEACLLAMESELGVDRSGGVAPWVYAISFEDSARQPCFSQVQKLREHGVPAEMDFEQRSAKAQMRMADRLGAQYCFLIGERELQQEEVLVKDMESGDQWNVSWDQAAAEMADLYEPSE